MSPPSSPLVSVSETTPLTSAVHLDAPGHLTTAPSLSTPVTEIEPANWKHAALSHLWRWRVMYVAGLFAFLVDFPSFMGEASKVRMLELALCREHYAITDPAVIRPDGSVAEYLCKVSDVQSRLALLRGYLSTLENLPGLALAVPYGILADTRGRRLVLVLSVLGLVLRDSCLWTILYFYHTFPLRAVYAAPLFVLLGGGPTVASATSLAVLAAAIPEAKRTQAFLYFQVTILISELLAPPLGSLLLDATGPHVAFLCTLPIICLAFAPILFLPNEKRTGEDPSQCSGGHSSATSPDGSNGPERFWTKLKERAGRSFESTTNGISILLLKRSMLLGVASLAIQKLARPMSEILLQYMSVRFNWSLSKSAFLITLQAAAQMVLFIFIVPLLYQWLMKRMACNGLANLALARICVTFLIIGTLFMALAPTAPWFITALLVYTCGTGFSHAMRSFLTSLLSTDRITILYTTMALFEGVASLVASPLLGLAFSAGIRMGGLAIALPFFIAAGLYTLAAAGVCLIRRE